jgi:hypothetical protein
MEGNTHIDPSTPREALGGKQAERGPSGELDAEYAQYKLTVQISALMASYVPKRQRKVAYELDNIIERWLISMVNMSGAPEDHVDWAKVYRRSRPDETFNVKLLSELIEKRVVSRAKGAELLGLVLRLVADVLARPLVRIGAEARCDGVRITYGAGFTAELTPRVRQLVALGGCDAAARVVMRYASLWSHGQQWAVPRRFTDELYERHNLRNEGFASPLNSFLLGKPDARFCSLFPDTDAPFGAIGGFFGIHMANYPGAWLVNPPFVEALLSRAAAQVVAALQAGLGAVVFFVAPAWTDSDFCSVLGACGFVAAQRRLLRDTYSFEDPGGESIPGKFDSLVYALAREPDPALQQALERW